MSNPYIFVNIFNINSYGGRDIIASEELSFHDIISYFEQFKNSGEAIVFDFIFNRFVFRNFETDLSEMKQYFFELSERIDNKEFVLININSIPNYYTKFSDIKKAIFEEQKKINFHEKFYVKFLQFTYTIHKTDIKYADFEEQFNRFMNVSFLQKNVEKERRKFKMEFRVSDEEKKAIEDRAKESEMKFSDFARQMLMHGQVKRITAEERRALKGIATNINQMAKRSNLGYSPDFSAIQEFFKEIEKYYL